MRVTIRHHNNVVLRKRSLCSRVSMEIVKYKNTWNYNSCKECKDEVVST